MKDFIVLLATIVLGVAIAAIVLALRGKANDLNTKATGGLDTLFN